MASISHAVQGLTDAVDPVVEGMSKLLITIVAASLQYCLTDKNISKHW